MLTLALENYRTFLIINRIAPYETNVSKYLGMNMDAKLRCKYHIKEKYRELDIRYRKYY